MGALVPISDEFPANGTQTQFTFTFALHGTFNDVIVDVAPPNSVVFVRQTIVVDFTLDRTTSTITFLVAPSSGSTVRITRCTVRTRQQDYTSGSTVLADENLDAEAHQLFDVIQEIEGAVATTVVIGATVTDISIPTIQQAVGDGVRTDFVIDGVRNIVRAQAFVTVDNVIQPAIFASPGPYYSIVQEDDSDYPSGHNGDDVVRFVVAPPNGAQVAIRVLRGVVLAAIADDSITTAMIQDGAITVAKLAAGAGVDVRVPVYNTSGVANARQFGPEDLLRVGAGGLSTVLANAINATIRLSDLVLPPIAAVGMGNQAVTDVLTPTAADPSTRAATKGFVDAAVAGLVFPRIFFRSHLGTFNAAVGSPFDLDVGLSTWRLVIAYQIAAFGEIVLYFVTADPVTPQRIRGFEITLASGVGEADDGDVTFERIGSIMRVSNPTPGGITWVNPVTIAFSNLET